jgi:hypothetical protein
MITRLKFSRHVMDLVLNHRVKNTTGTYDRHGYEDEIREAMDAAASRIVELASIPPKNLSVNSTGA